MKKNEKVENVSKKVVAKLIANMSIHWDFVKLNENVVELWHDALNKIGYDEEQLNRAFDILVLSSRSKPSIADFAELYKDRFQKNTFYSMDKDRVEKIKLERLEIKKKNQHTLEILKKMESKRDKNVDKN